jgi:hypothetical protein
MASIIMATYLIVNKTPYNLELKIVVNLIILKILSILIARNAGKADCPESAKLISTSEINTIKVSIILDWSYAYLEGPMAKSLRTLSTVVIIRQITVTVY